MNSENFMRTGNTSAQGVLATHQGSGDPDDKTASFYEEKEISAMVDQWRNSPGTFLDNSPMECNVACWIYKNSSTLPEMSLVDVVKRRVFLVHYYRLCCEFGKSFFGQGNSSSLRLFLEHHLVESEQQKEQVKIQHRVYEPVGRRYDYLCKATQHPGLLFLSTSFTSTQLESKDSQASILEAAAVKSIALIGKMEKYDEAAKKIHDILERHWTSWLDSIKPVLSARVPVERLFFDDEISVFIRPSPSCHSQAGRSLSAGTASSAVPGRIGPVQETLVTAPEAVVAVRGIPNVPNFQETSFTAPGALAVARDATGLDRQFDVSILRQAIVLVPDFSGCMRPVHVSTLSDLLNNHSTSSTWVQMQPPQIVCPATMMHSEASFDVDTFGSQQNLW